jgi:hypothetical protein
MTTPSSDTPTPGKPASRTREEVAVKNWVTTVTTEATLTQQAKIIKFLLRAYGGLLFATMLIFILAGI